MFQIKSLKSPSITFTCTNTCTHSYLEKGNISTFTVNRDKETRVTDSFNINRYINFASSNTRSGTNQKLIHSRSSSTVQQHFYFNRIARLYNYLPVIDLSLSISTIKHRLKNYFWSHFNNNFNSERACSFHLLCPCYCCIGAPCNFNL